MRPCSLAEAGCPSPCNPLPRRREEECLCVYFLSVSECSEFRTEQTKLDVLAGTEAAGTLLARLDPTGNGVVVAGFGDQREVELLVEAGFTPLEAIHIAKENGAKFLGEDNRVGTLRPGKQADIGVVKGDPGTNIGDIENVEIVFEDGKGYDSQKTDRLGSWNCRSTLNETDPDGHSAHCGKRQSMQTSKSDIRRR